MSSLNDQEKRYLEALLNMGGGYVLDFSDASFGAFFRQHGINIDSPKYHTNGTSKAKRLRSFWEQDPDHVVGPVLEALLRSFETTCEIEGRKPNDKLLGRSRAAVARLLGKPTSAISIAPIDAFLQEAFPTPDLHRLPIDMALVPIIHSRYEEARVAMKHGAYLAVVILCGSILEAVLLAAGQAEPARFNRSPASPKRKDGKLKPFHEWSLANFIDVATDIGMFAPDIHKFGHGLRDFRNYVHPYQQLLSSFHPDEHTAAISLQVLKAALASIAGDRK